MGAAPSALGLDVDQAPRADARGYPGAGAPRLLKWQLVHWRIWGLLERSRREQWIDAKGTAKQGRQGEREANAAEPASKTRHQGSPGREPGVWGNVRQRALKVRHKPL